MMRLKLLMMDSLRVKMRNKIGAFHFPHKAVIIITVVLPLSLKVLDFHFTYNTSTRSYKSKIYNLITTIKFISLTHIIFFFPSNSTYEALY